MEGVVLQGWRSVSGGMYEHVHGQVLGLRLGLGLGLALIDAGWPWPSDSCLV